MKHLLPLVLLVIPALCVGQVSMSWTDTLHVTTTAVDTAFSTERWESCTLFFSGCTGLIKYAFSTADTTGWAADSLGKKWLRLAEGQVFTITTNKELRIPGLKFLAYKAESGSGTLYITGTKRVYE